MMLQKRLFILGFLWLCCLTATAQRKIALEHNGASTFFNDIPAAVSAAVSGDIIYLPGGFFPGFTIDKGITVIGVGHHPDSTVVTMRTQINGPITLTPSADNSFLTGLNIAGSIIASSESGNLDGVRITRCVAGDINIEIDGASSNWLIDENVLGVISFPAATPAQNMTITNNIGTGVKNVQNSILQNNIFFGWPVLFGCGLTGICSYGIFFNVSYSTIKNSIFSQSYTSPLCCSFNAPPSGSSYCYYYNNINGGINDNDGSNAGSGNILGVDINTLFVQYTPGWDYSDDFHLVNPAYNTGGSDGTPIGIYGGMFPWKAGSLPFNPHINLKVIAPSTNGSGNLPVQIRARAQNN